MELALDSYHIYFDEQPDASSQFASWLNKQSYEQIFVLCDTHTKSLCYPLIASFLPVHHIIEIPAGESHKHIQTCTYIWQQLAVHEAGRNCLMINLGGGVIGDMGGFAASTYKRGIDFIQVPSTLLSQVDASVGGKLAIDLEGIKNLVGLFQNPKAVFISPYFLKTLPSRELNSGFAEMLKHGFILDAEYLQRLPHHAVSNMHEMMQLIYDSVALKKKVVTEDPYEKGLRKILNFGHTIGHAVETWSMQHDEDPLLHGEAIAIGMICEAKLSQIVNGFQDDDLQLLTNRLMQQFSHYPLENIPFDALMRIMKLDKKNTQQAIRFSLLSGIGHCDFDITASDAQIAEAIAFYSGL